MNRSESLRIRKECATLCDSRSFRSTLRMRRLLCHLVERTLAGDRQALTQRRLALDFFGRNSDFNPEEDTIVRVEISKLRRSLREFYEAQIECRDVVILLHPSNYTLIFEFRRDVGGELPVDRTLFDVADPSRPCETTGRISDLGWLSNTLRSELAEQLQQNPSRYVSPRITDLVNCDQLDPLGEDLDVFEGAIRFNHYLHHMTTEAYQQARQCLERLFQHKQDNPMVLSMVGEIRRAGHALGFMRDRGQLEESIEMHRESITKDTDYLSCKVSYGFSLLALGEIDELRTLARSVVNLADAPLSVRADMYLLLALSGEWAAGSRGVRETLADTLHYPTHIDYVHCLAAYDDGDYETARDEIMGVESTGFFWEHVLKAACCGQLKLPQAETELAALCRARPDFATNGREYLGAFISSEKTFNDLLLGLGKAGLKVS